MSISRRVSGGAMLVAISVAVMGGAIAVTVLRSDGSKTFTAARPSHAAAARPKAVIDHLIWDLGTIESGKEFAHTFLVSNEGQAPLRLTRGPSECACTVTELPDEPIPPGGKAKVKLAFTEAAKQELLKLGPFARDVHLLTNDPDHRDIVLGVAATVNRRLIVAPTPITLAIDSSKPTPEPQRSAVAWVYSERWEAFELSVAKLSRENIHWRIEPATGEKLKEFKARSGYRVVVTLPAEMAEGRFAEWVEFAAKSAAGKGVSVGKGVRNRLQETAQQPQAKLGRGSHQETIADAASAADAISTSCRLDIQGRVDGRLTFYSPKVVRSNVLQLGVRQQGQRVHETLVMKVNDPRHRLTAVHIEAEPAFLQARLAPLPGGAKDVGLYRLEVEIPGDAPSCAYTGAHCGSIRLRTDHPRLGVIELKVEFVLTGGSGGAGHVATR